MDGKGPVSMGAQAPINTVDFPHTIRKVNTF